MTPPGERVSAEPISDADLLRRAQAGDDAAFDMLASRHERALYRVAFFLTGNASDAEDVLQETLLGAYERLESFESRASLKTWLSRILMRQAARHHRSQRVRQNSQPVRLSEASKAMLEGWTSPSASSDSDIRMDVLDVLQTLRPEHREVIVLRELQGLGYQEIADVLNIPGGTVESRLFRARKEMKERLQSYL